MKPFGKSNAFLRKTLFVFFLFIMLSVKGIAQDCSGFSFTYSTTVALCPSTGSITINVSGGVGPYNYKVEGPSLPSMDYTSSNVILGLPAGTYTIYVQDIGIGGCGIIQQTGAIVTTSYTNPVFSFSTIDVSCAGNDGEIRLTGVTGGRAPFEYTILAGSPTQVGANNATGIFTGLVPGKYYIQAKDACNTLRTTEIDILDFGWLFNGVSVSRLTCDSANAVVTLMDNKGNNSFSSVFNGFQYGVVNAVGDTTWFSTPGFRFYIGKNLTGRIVAKDPCGNLFGRNWTVSAAQIPSVGAVATSSYDCDSTFTASITNPVALTNPNYCIYNSSNNLLGCNTTGVFTNLSYGSYCIQVRDGCLDTTIIRCFTSSPPRPSVAATVQQYNQTCATFTAAVAGQLNLAGATYCLVNNGPAFDTIACNATGIFNNIPYGNYCIRIKSDPYCYDTTITRCFTATRPLPAISAVRMLSLQCNTLIVDTLQGSSNAPSTQFCLYDQNGVEIRCNSTGVFDNIPHGNYCIRSRSECGDLSAPYCFNTSANRPSVGNNIVRTNRTCATFTAYISDTSRLVNPVYEILDANNVLIATNGTGVFNNLRYGSYCIKVKNDPTCYDTTFTRCFTETRPPITISANLIQSNTTCTAFTATITGTGLTNPVYYILNSSNDTLASNTTGIFNNLPYGPYCAVIRDGCDTALRICQTFEPLRGITVNSYIACTLGNAVVAGRLTSRNNPNSFYFYHPDGRLLHSVLNTWSDYASVDLPGLPAGAQYKIVGVDNCGRRDSAYIAPVANRFIRNTAVQQRCISTGRPTGSGDLTITSYSDPFGTVTPRLIKMNTTTINQTYTTRSGDTYRFLNLEPATYVLEYTLSQCNTTSYDTIVVNPYQAPAPGNSAIFQCDNNSFTINTHVVNGIGPFTYQIIESTPATPSINTGPQSSPIFAINNSTAYSQVRVLATDVCNNGTTNAIGIQPLGSLLISRTEDCLFHNITLSVTDLPNASYHWYKKTSETDSVLVGTGRTYNIPFMTVADIATYVCKTTVNTDCLTRLSYLDMKGDCGGVVLQVALQLTGRKSQNGNLLSWNIEPGQQAAYSVERKVGEEKEFRTIAAGGFTLNQSSRYSFIDPKPYNGRNQYQIKKTTPSGGVEYSSTLAITNASSSIEVYPNPVKESFTVTVACERAANFTITLYTIDGQMLFTKQLLNVTAADVIYNKPAGVQAGTYVLRITNQSTGRIDTRKLLFQ